MKTIRLFLLSALIFGAISPTTAHGMITRSKAKQMALGASESEPIAGAVKSSKKRSERPVDPTDPIIEDEHPAKKQKVDHPVAGSKDEKAPKGEEPAELPKKDEKDATQDTKQAEVSPFNVILINKRLAQIKYDDGGYFQLELGYQTIVKRIADLAAKSGINLAFKAPIPYKILLWYCLPTENHKDGCVKYDVLDKDVKITDLFHVKDEDFENTPLAQLLRLAACYHGYQVNKQTATWNQLEDAAKANLDKIFELLAKDE